MQSEEQAEIIRRLRTTRGHLEAVIRMVDKGEPCEQVLHQLGAVQAALRSAGTRLILCQLSRSREVILYSPCPEDRAAELASLRNLYSLMTQYASSGWKNASERKTE